MKNVFLPRILFQVPMDGDFAFITGDVKRNIPPFQCVADFPGGKPVRVVRSGAGDGQLWRHRVVQSRDKAACGTVVRQDEHVRRQVRAASQQGPQVRRFGISGQQGEAVPVEDKPEHQPVIAGRRHAGGRGQHLKRQPVRKGEHVSRAQSMTGNSARGKDGGERFGERPGRSMLRRVDAFKRSGVCGFHRIVGCDEQQAFEVIPVGMRYGDEVQPGQVVGGKHQGNEIPSHVETVGKQPAAVHHRPSSVGPFQKYGLPLSDI